MPATQTNHAWELVVVEGMPIEAQQQMLGTSYGPVTYHLLVPKGREADAVKWLRGLADRWEAVELRWAAQQAAKAAAPPKAATPIAGMAAASRMKGAAALAPPMSAAAPASAAPTTAPVQTAAIQPAPSGQLTQEAQATVRPDALCMRAECGAVFRDHVNNQPFPHLTTGCPAFAPTAVDPG